MDPLRWGLLTLLRQKSARPEIYWKQTTFAKALNCDLTTVNKYIGDLIKLGFVTTTNHGRFGNSYTVLVDGPSSYPGALADRLLGVQLEIAASKVVADPAKFDLRRRRKALGLTQKRLAQLSNITASKLCLFEMRDGELRPDEQVRIVKALQAEALRLGVTIPVSMPPEVTPSHARTAEGRKHDRRLLEKAEGTLLDRVKPAVAEAYLAIGKRQLQKLVSKGTLVSEGSRQRSFITVASILIYQPFSPE